MVPERQSGVVILGFTVYPLQLVYLIDHKVTK
ncbi:hypothetical protein MNBD_NITROSPINAE01-874 [hydrothermal vent metagenome]|uniref:Uncharacterized protein n=1 Tax=hydrothermal vent metagenome TaxID=652676 RepID=A0A3B1CDY4_9ZZZZ